jgi:hypothetical protein
VASEAAGPNITIDWNDVAREQNYLVYRDDVWIATLPANTIHYVDTQACTTHTYVIAASNCAGTTKDPAVSSDVGSRTPVPPPAPTGVVASDCGTQSFVHVIWNDITGEDGYRVFRDGAQIAQVAQGVVSYDDATGTPNQVYAYTVKSFRVCDGNSAASAPDNGCRTVPPPTWTYISTAGVGTSDLTGVYDDRDAKMLTFGGQDFTGELADVWALFPPDTLWARLWTPGGSAAGTPSPRQRPALVYSPNLDAMLSFGGFGSAPWNGDLWWLDLTGNFISGLRWYKINSTGGPVYEGTCKAVYDPVANRMIVVSPYEGVFALSTSNYQWTQIYTGALDPSKIGTDGFQCVYDPIGDRLLVFGGTTAGGPQHTTVWAMLLRGAATWTALVTTGLSQVSHGTMVWDPENEKVMLYGGTFGPSLNADVWTLNTSGTPAWTRLTTAGAPPGARWRHAAAYDWHNDRMVISGGIGTSGYRLSDSWALTFPDFTPPAPAPEIYVDALSSDQMGIVWTNSGDDGMHGIARINDIRYAQWALDAANWDMSPRIPAGPPQAAGTPEEFWVSGLQPCTRYWVGMKVIDEAGNESAIVTSGPVRTLCMGGGGFPAGASEVDSAQVSLDLPTTVEFSRIYPNPANAQTTISYGVPADYAGKKVQVTVFDLAGRSIRSLASEAASPGRRTLHWDLRNETGSRVDNGIYYVRFTLGDITRVQRVAAIR